MKNTKRGFNKNLNRNELPFLIYCSYCKKHICDSVFEMEPKLCMTCSGQYEKILTYYGVKNNPK
jgi:hypothetical protein